MSRRINIRDEYRNKFYQLPKVFFTSERYMSMSNNAKIAWAILRDRSNLSAKNNWVDDNGDIYFIYTNKDLMEILNIGSNSTLQKVKKELLDAELLEQERMGLQKANRLYLLNPLVTMDDVYMIDKSEQEVTTEIEKDKEDSSETSPLHRSTKSVLQLSENRSTESVRPEVQKVYTNHTELNKTKDNKDNKDHRADHENNLFNSSVKEKDKDSDQELIEAMIKNQQLELLFGEGMLNILKLRSRGNLDLFKEWVDLITYAIKSAEEEKKESLFIHLYDNSGNSFSMSFKDDLTTTVNNVLFKIRTDKYQKIKDQKSYLFTSVKRTAEHWADNASNL